MQYHLVFTRINPTLRIDTLRICTLESGQAVSVGADDFLAVVSSDIPALSDFFHKSDISDELYIYHSNIKDILDCLVNFKFSVDYFDNNLVIVFDYEQKEKASEKK